MPSQVDIQTITFPYSATITTSDLNRLMIPSVPSGRSIITGFQVQQTGNTSIKITKGHAIKDFTLISYSQDVEIYLDTTLDTIKYVVLTYSRPLSEPTENNPEKALIQVKEESEVQLESDLILGFVEVSNHVIVNIYDVHPGNANLAREVDTHADEKISDHNTDSTAHQDIRQAIETIAAINKEKGIAGETIPQYAPVCKINGKFYVASSKTVASERNHVIGIALTSGVLDSEIEVQTIGAISNPAWSFTVGGGAVPMAFLNGNTVSQQAPPTPATDLVIKVGDVIGTDTIFIRPQLIVL